jgi:hypothetical protein
MRRHSNTHVGHELSRFLVAYLLTFLSVLILVHVLQPAREGPATSSRSPLHRERQTTANHPSTIQARQDRQPVDPSRLGFNSLQVAHPRHCGAPDYPIPA